MKKCQYKNCKKKHNNKKYCSVKCRFASVVRTLPITYGLKHEPNEIVSTVRGVLKQAKTVFEYQQMAKTSEDRAMSEKVNPYGK